MPPLAPARRALLLAHALGALAVPLAAQTQPTAFTFPTHVAGFRMISREEMKPGMAVRYQRGRDPHVDVYVYPAFDSACASACDSVAVRKEVDGFGALIPQLLERRYYDSLRIALDETLEVPSGGGALRGRHLRLAGGQRGRPVTSQYYLLGAGELLVKTRATYAPDSAMDAAVEAFVRAFAAASRPIACADGPANSDGMVVEMRLPVPPAEAAPRVEAALRKLGYEPFPLDEPNTWGSTTVSAWPDRDPWRPFREAPHPGVELRVAVKRARGGRSELQVAARAACRFTAPAGFPATPGVTATHMVELVAATEVIAEFPEAEKPR